MKVIIWELSEEQIGYLKKNCKEQFETGEICVMDTDLAQEMLLQIKSGWQGLKEILLISENVEILADAVLAGMAAAVYQKAEDFGNQILPSVDMVIEGFEEVDFLFLERIYQRHYKIPWKILETKRLMVRELDLTDMDDLFELYTYEGMTDYMEGLYPYEEEYQYQKAYIENMYRFFGYGMWLVFEKKSGKLVGRAGVEHREEFEGELEFGYAIGTPYQGIGYATEVCEGILDYVKQELGFEAVYSLVEPKNQVSVHLLEKLGFLFEKEMLLDGIFYKKYQKML